MTTSEQLERELKFDVPQAWSLPDPATLRPDGQVRVETVELASTYFDTADNDLLRSGVTLRRRTGDTDTGWHLKVPAGDARTEIHAPLGDENTPPDELLRLLRGITGGAQLRPIATLTTTRTVHHLADADGRPVAQIADDEVTATGAQVTGDSTTWREVEVELDGGGEDFLSESAVWLSKSGAQPATSKSKIGRAVGLDGSAGAQPPDSLAALVHDYLAEQVRQLIRGDIALRREQDVIHATRVATRRYRSVLRVFADLFDDSAPALDAELKWYAGVLGAVRDVQVLRKHLMATVHSLPPEVVLGPVTSSLWQILERDELAGRETLAAALDSDRYATLLRTVREYTDRGPAGADRPAGAVRRWVRRADRQVIKRLQTAAADPGHDELMHRARKAAKRARYAAELAQPVLGKAAKRLVTRDKRLQDELGELQDAVVAAAFLRRAGAEIGVRPGENGFTVGVLWQLEQERAQRERERARKEVKKLA